MELTSITRQIPYIQIPTTTVGTLKRLKLHLAAALIQISKNVSVNILSSHARISNYLSNKSSIDSAGDPSWFWFK